MSRATKRKHVLNEVLQDDYSPPTENQQIVRVLNSRGNNLHEVEATDKTTFLTSMPTKFRKNVWIKRGDYVLVEPIEEGDKVKAEIVRILTPDHIKYFKKDNVWPKEFEKNSSDQLKSTNVTENKSDSASEDSSSDELFVNPNRVRSQSSSAESSSSDSED